MTRERDDIIAPYEELKLIIDNLIHGLDDAKSQIQGYMSDLKKSQQTGKAETSSQAKYCTTCGSKVVESHKFCAQCGKKL